MVGNALVEIGREIINISTAGSEDLQNFFKVLKGNDLSGSTMLDTESIQET